MNRMKWFQIFLGFFCLVLIIACQPSTEQKISTEKIEKKSPQENQKPPEADKTKRMLEIAENDFQNHSFESAKKTLETLLKDYPDFSESDSARILLKKIDAELSKKISYQKKEPAPVAAIKKMRIMTVPETGTTWYKDENTTRFNDINSFYLYFGKRGNEPPELRLRIRYCGNGWLHIMSFMAIIDNNRFMKPLAKFKQLMGTTNFQELFDERITPEDHKLLKKIIQSDKTTIRFQGQKGYADIMLTQAQKESMKNVLDAFKEIQGNL